MTTIIHQLVHGYRQGHELMASSVKLESADADLILRLSDLSGTLTDDSDIQPYLTIYPLPTKRWFALGKTWIDESAPRSGCVLTHTLLVDTEEWARHTSPRQFASLFLKPSRMDLDRFRKQLRLPDENSRSNEEFHLVKPKLAASFVSKCFGQGISPIIWFGEEDSEKITWSITNGLWPHLRANFSCCSLSLHPRSLVNKSFDLLFAPKAAYNRFHNLPREHFLNSDSNQIEETRIEPWCHELADIIFTGNHPELRNDLTMLLDQFSGAPTSIRRLFLIKDLKARAASSPSAIIGVLDVVESLSPESDSAVTYKEIAIQDAIGIIQSLSNREEAARCLLLLSERLEKKAFIGISKNLRSILIDAVALQTQTNPELMLEIGDRHLVSQGGLGKSTFSAGLLWGLQSLHKKSPTKLQLLSNFRELGRYIIENDPTIALGFFEGITQESAHVMGKVVVGWINAIHDSSVSRKLRELLLPELVKAEEYPIISSLLHSLPKKEVSHTLDYLSQATDAFRIGEIRDVIAEEISTQHASSLRAWAAKSPVWSRDIASIIAASYSLDIHGFQELVNESQFSSDRKPPIISSFLRKISRPHYPHWFHEFATRDARFLGQMLAGGPKFDAEVLSDVESILETVEDLPIVRGLESPQTISGLSQLKLYDQLVDRVMRNLLSGFFLGDISSRECEVWQEESWAQNWLQHVNKRDIQTQFSTISRADSEIYKRGWIWLCKAPLSLYSKRPSIIPELIDGLISSRDPRWSEEVTNLWVQILRRIMERDQAIRLKLCVQALQFAFGHPKLPLSQLVAETFMDVYLAVTTNQELASETSDLFGFWDWDKGKELRNKLVNLFYHSDWPPGNLVIATRDPKLLRKIFKRLYRKEGGEEYVIKMLNDENSYKDKSSLRLRNELSKLARKPDFVEEWD